MTALPFDLFLRYNLGAPSLIFDIGACDFEDSIKIKSHFHCSVQAFEPNPFAFKRFSSIALAAGIEVHNLAFGSVHEERDFYCSESASGAFWPHSSSFFAPRRELFKKSWNISFAENPIKVQCTTLNKFCLEKQIRSIDLLHIDAQGAEIEICSAIDQVNVKAIWAEVNGFGQYHIDASESLLTKTLANQGFRLVMRGNDNLYIKD
jgi:FkbM family methyltransferase